MKGSSNMDTNTDIISAAINNAVHESLAAHSFEDIIKERVDKAIREAVEDACRWGNVRDAIRRKIDELMVPAIENYDLAACNVKLETLLDMLIEESAVAERREILKNAKLLMSKDAVPTETGLSDIFDQYGKWVASDYNNSGREVDCGVYESISIRMTVEPQPKSYSGSIIETAIVRFEVTEKDDPNDCNESFCRTVPMSRYYRDNYWTISGMGKLAIADLRKLDKFMTRIACMGQQRTHIYITDNVLEDDIDPDATPELEYV